MVKNWRNLMDWTGWKWRPSSYLLSLLMVRAYETACHAAEGSLPSSKSILRHFVKLVLSTENSRFVILCIKALEEGHTSFENKSFQQLY